MTVVSIPTDQIPEGIKSVHVGVTSFVATALDELSALNSKRVFVVANNSSRKFLEGSDDDDSKGSKLFINVLRDKGLLAAPLCTSIGMGGGEEGLLAAADAAYEADADVVVTVGGGAVQDAGKLIRLWLSTRQKGSSGGGKATVEGIQAAAKCDPMPPLPPQIAIPVSSYYIC